jgi:MFS family permease
MMFACGMIAGPLFDKGYMMTSLCTVLWQFVAAQGVCIGLGSGLIFIPMIGLIAQWFNSKRGIANGLASSGSGVG